MPLFDRKLVPSASIVAAAQATLTKDQKAFNTLIKKIEGRRAKLSEWNTAIPIFKRKYVSDLLPLEDKELELKTQFVTALDRAAEQKGVTKGELRKLSTLIVDICESVLASKDHDELKRLYNKHSDSDFDAEQAAHEADVKSFMESVLGMNLGDDVDMGSPEEVLKKVEEQYRDQEAAYQAKQAQRKKSARELAKEAKQEVEEKHMSQSIREVYRKLASALHPDREPDADERQRKTELMQRANKAYEKGNLLQLLELQLELEHIDQAHLANLDAPRLKRYIKILKTQLEDLDSEIQQIEDEFSLQFGLPPFQKIEPISLLPMLQGDVAVCKRAIAELRRHIEIAADPKQLKAWLKTIKLQRRVADDLDVPF